MFIRESQRSASGFTHAAVARHLSLQKPGRHEALVLRTSVLQDGVFVKETGGRDRKRGRERGRESERRSERQKESGEREGGRAECVTWWTLSSW